MEKDTLKLQLVKAVQRLMVMLFLLICCLGSLGLMSLLDKANTKECVVFGTVDSPVNNPTLKLGKTLFINNCAQCHAKDMKTKLTGPALYNVQNRWQDDAALFDWIVKGSVPDSKTGYINDLKRNYNNLQMPRFAHFKEKDVQAILTYIGRIK